MKLSHRDFQIDDALARAFWGMAALVLGVGAIAVYATWAWLGIASLLALAVLGGLYVLRSDRAFSTYVGELRSVQSGAEVNRWVRFEVGSEVGVERPVGLPSRRSPHARVPSTVGRRLPPPGDSPD